MLNSNSIQFDAVYCHLNCNYSLGSAYIFKTNPKLSRTASENSGSLIGCGRTRRGRTQAPLDYRRHLLDDRRQGSLLILALEFLPVEPHGQSPWHLTNARAGRHPGQKLAHSSTAKGRGFLQPRGNDQKRVLPKVFPNIMILK